MICSILLLIILTSCVSGTLVVNVTQTSYQAEENHHITLEWTFTTNPHTSSNSLNIFCELLTDLRPSVLFHLHEGVEVPESQDEQFAGRVQWDKDVLREGQLRLHVSRLRTEDSGLYECKVFTSYGRSSGKCWLHVTGTLVVNVTQTSYQAEENQHITLEWTFTTNPHTSSNSLNIFCELLTDLRPSVLFYLHDGVEVPESQDEQFAGRIQWDKDVLREGRIRLHVSRLRTEDSGLYKCYVDTDYGRNSGRFWLNVTAADEPKTQRPTVRPEPESLGNIWILYAGLAAAAGAVLLILCLCVKYINKKRNIYSAVKMLSLSEKRAIRTNSLTQSGPSLNESSEHKVTVINVRTRDQNSSADQSEVTIKVILLK